MSPGEHLKLAQLARHMGKVSKSYVVEEALRTYLPMVDEAGAYIRRALPALTLPSTSARAGATRFVLDEQIMSGLNEVSERYGWDKAELIRQALAAKAAELSEEPDDRSRRRKRR